jgi:hypothetical protein
MDCVSKEKFTELCSHQMHFGNLGSLSMMGPSSFGARLVRIGPTGIRFHGSIGDYLCDVDCYNALMRAVKAKFDKCYRYDPEKALEACYKKELDFLKEFVPLLSIDSTMQFYRREFPEISSSPVTRIPEVAVFDLKGDFRFLIFTDGISAFTFPLIMMLSKVPFDRQVDVLSRFGFGNDDLAYILISSSPQTSAEAPS